MIGGLGLLSLLLAAPSPATIDGALLRDGFRDGDLEEAAGGRVVAKVVDTEDRRGVATVGLLRVRTTAERFLACVRDPRCLEGSEDLMAAGRLERGDLAALPLDDRELEQLRECRRRGCALHLGGEAIERLVGLDWSRPGSPGEAAAVYRRTLAGYGRDYTRAGNRALPIYEGGPRPVEPARTLEDLLERPLAGLDEAPDLRRYLLAFPAEAPERVEEFLTWSKEKAWRKRVIALHHVVILDRSGPAGVLILVASKQIYASQCYESALRVLRFEGPRGDDRASLVFVSRARADIRPSGFTWLERLLLRRLVTRRLAGQLRLLKERLETGSEPAVALEAGTRSDAGPGSPSGTLRR